MSIFLFLLSPVFSKAQDHRKIPPRPKQTFEHKLATLKRCGIELAPPFTVKDLLKDFDRSEFEQEGYDMLLFALAGREEEPPERYFSANVWHYDPESVVVTGDYKVIALRLMEMTQGSLKLEDIQDYMDIDKKVAWLSFTFKGKKKRINFKVTDDWADPKILSTFVDLLKESDPSKLYLVQDEGGQDCTIVCVTRKNYDCLSDEGITFTPLP